jgi:hypothetical protein
MKTEGYGVTEILESMEYLCAHELKEGKIAGDVLPYMAVRMRNRQANEAVDRFEEEHRKVKEEERLAAKRIFGESRKDTIGGILDTIIKFLDHGMSRGEYLSWMWEMHTKQPDCGWDVEAKKLERFYDNRHLL